MKRLFLIGMFLILSLNLTACGKEKEETEFSIKEIGELTTLECYYHLVAEYKDDSLPVLGFVSDIGYKKVWIECDGVVEYGIDMDEMDDPKRDGNKITIELPEAKIQGTKIVVDSISEPVYDSGLFTSNASTENESEAMKSAEKELETLAKENKDMIKQARENAKETISAFVDKVAESDGKEYEIVWKEK